MARLLHGPLRPDAGPGAAIPSATRPPVDDDVDASPFFADLFALLEEQVY